MLDHWPQLIIATGDPERVHLACLQRVRHAVIAPRQLQK